MAPMSSYEMAASILLCAEDSSSILDLEAEAEEEEVMLAPRSRTRTRGEPSVEFPVPSEECVDGFVEAEAAHMPREDYAERLRGGGMDLRVRMDAIDWIWKVHRYYGFGPLTACLAVNYLDRFLSLYQLPEGKAWTTQLLSVACLSLAAKMEETYVPPSLDLQQVGDARYVFEAKTIQRMELLVLSTLKWRMQAVTPFSYIDYFLHRLNGGGGDAPSRRAVLRSAELILCIARGTHCLDFRPSEIAAAVAAAVAGEEHAVDIVDKACTHRVHKERVSRCLEAIQAATVALPGTTVPQPLMKTEGTSSGRRAASSGTATTVPRSPTGVLDAAGCLSYRSDDTAAAAAAAAASSHATSSWRDEDDDSSSPVVVCSKRRKISR
ncbi:cyclin-D4-1 isoform X1 [Sorghum bicolor]|uniref:cyclin-D4-1 isoform X1 n=1 Tax=Sorghum bicolor TaxID=4558 RepID=UPI000B423800|nr:cyclin-D4-1 isoform X1 [Sorghum bicolor]|eukprot:XP_021308413.1 cyclin-D4-1 isoform X1 [Sorghum bicolor]